MSELLTMASGPPSRQTLTELLATLPAPAALCDETLQWLTANEAYHQLFPDRAAGAQLERLRAAGLDRQLAMQPAARHFVVEAVSADAGHASQPTGRIRLKVGRVDSADAGGLCWILAEALEPADEGRRNPIADRRASGDGRQRCGAIRTRPMDGKHSSGTRPIGAGGYRTP